MVNAILTTPAVGDRRGTKIDIVQTYAITTAGTPVNINKGHCMKATLDFNNASMLVTKRFDERVDNSDRAAPELGGPHFQDDLYWTPGGVLQLQWGTNANEYRKDANKPGAFYYYMATQDPTRPIHVWRKISTKGAKSEHEFMGVFRFFQWVGNPMAGGSVILTT